MRHLNNTNIISLEQYMVQYGSILVHMKKNLELTDFMIVKLEYDSIVVKIMVQLWFSINLSNYYKPLSICVSNCGPSVVQIVVKNGLISVSISVQKWLKSCGTVGQFYPSFAPPDYITGTIQISSLLNNLRSVCSIFC